MKLPKGVAGKSKFIWDMTMNVVFRKEKGGDKEGKHYMSHCSLCPQTMKLLSISFSFSVSFQLSLPLCAVACILPRYLPPSKTVFLCQCPDSSPPSSLSLDLCSQPHLSWPVGSVYNKTQAGRLAEAQRLCFFTGTHKETQGGYCWDTASLCITSA